MQNMAVSAASNAASSAAAASTATAAAATAAAGTTVVAAGMTTGTIVGATTAVGVGAAAAVGAGVVGIVPDTTVLQSALTFCTPGYGDGCGSISIPFDIDKFMENEKVEWESRFVEVYNTVSPQCSEKYERIMQNATLTSNSTEDGLVVTEWLACVTCYPDCPKEPLFGDAMDDIAERFLQATTGNEEGGQFSDDPSESPSAAPSLSRELIDIGEFLSVLDAYIPSSEIPSTAPSAGPSATPSEEPSTAPSDVPSRSPTVTPGNPTKEPTPSPSKEPSTSPSAGPTGLPSDYPTGSPTTSPSRKPTGKNSVN
jgi:hypothetical protein